MKAINYKVTTLECDEDAGYSHYTRESKTVRGVYSIFREARGFGIPPHRLTVVTIYEEKVSENGEEWMADRERKQETEDFHKLIAAGL